MLSILVKHLDHKNVLKQPDMQIDVVEVVTALARLTRVQSSVPIVSAVSDIMRHLRKSIHYSIDDAKLGEQVIKWNQKFYQVVDECLTELTSKVFGVSVLLYPFDMRNHSTNVFRYVYRSEMLVKSSMLWLPC